MQRSGAEYRYAGPEIRFARTLEDIKEDKLDEVDLCHIALSENQLRALYIAMRANHRITSLNLNHCKIGDRGIGYVAALLRQNHSIKSAILSDNDLTANGFEQLCQALINPDLYKKNLNAYSVIHGELTSLREDAFLDDDDDFFTRVNRSRDYNISIEELDVSSNRIGDSVLPLVRKLLLGSSCLRTLNLNFNPFSDAIRTEIRNAFALTDTLQHLKTVSKPSLFCDDTFSTGEQNKKEPNSDLFRNRRSTTKPDNDPAPGTSPEYRRR